MKMRDCPSECGTVDTYVIRGGLAVGRTGGHWTDKPLDKLLDKILKGYGLIESDNERANGCPPKLLNVI